jgi:thiosulfate reductase cytochrome b subunit
LQRREQRNALTGFSLPVADRLGTQSLFALYGWIFLTSCVVVHPTAMWLVCVLWILAKPIV